MEVCGQFHASVALSWGKSSRYPLDRKLGGPQNRSESGGEEREYLALRRIEPRSSNPQPSHYTDWAIPTLPTQFITSEFREPTKSVSKSFRTGLLEQELQMVQLSATRCSWITILWVSLGSFASITFCVVSQRVFIVVVYFVIDSVRKLMDTPSQRERRVYSFNFSNSHGCHVGINNRGLKSTDVGVH
jgi:hypothetical protein